MMNANYLQSLSRFTKSVTAELNNKLAGSIKMDLRPVIDPTGDAYVTSISNLQKNRTIGANQATWLLQQAGYLPENMPEKEKPQAQVQAVQVVSGNDNSTKGGDSDDEDSD